MERRIRQLSGELGFEPERVRGWGLSQAILAAIWSCEEDADTTHGVACAEAIANAKI